VIGGGPREQEGTEAAHELLAGQLPTAVVDYNDSCAIGLINTLQKSAIRVPDDISVVGTTTATPRSCPMSS
jgi:DNA-binding LacI/PurR family transcriptional regulator